MTYAEYRELIDIYKRLNNWKRLRLWAKVLQVLAMQKIGL